MTAPLSLPCGSYLFVINAGKLRRLILAAANAPLKHALSPVKRFTIGDDCGTASVTAENSH
jgi:hypothetical protein